MATTLSLRLPEGDMFIRLENESFSPTVRQALREHLPGVLCTPVTDARLAFLRGRRETMSLFSLPFNQVCPVRVETMQGKERSTAEGTAALRGVVMALRDVFKPTSNGGTGTTRSQD